MLTWETLSRVVATQFIVRAMSTIRDATKEALESNVAYVKSLAEVRAISPEKDIGQLSERMKELSANSMCPCNRSSRRKCQIISNQFTTTAQQTGRDDGRLEGVEGRNGGRRAGGGDRCRCLECFRL